VPADLPIPSLHYHHRTQNREGNTVEITSGLFDQIVLQAQPPNQSDAAFTGTCGAGGVVQARVTSHGKPVRGLNWARLSPAVSGHQFQGQAARIPARRAVHR